MVSLEGRGGKATPSPGRPEEMTNAQTDAENAGQFTRRTGGCIVARWGSKKKEFFFYTIEAVMCMKTNKEMTILPRQKATFVHI
jgi:hypothetical protein